MDSGTALTLVVGGALTLGTALITQWVSFARDRRVREADHARQDALRLAADRREDHVRFMEKKIDAFDALNRAILTIVDLAARRPTSADPADWGRWHSALTATRADLGGSVNRLTVLCEPETANRMVRIRELSRVYGDLLVDQAPEPDREGVWLELVEQWHRARVAVRAELGISVDGLDGPLGEPGPGATTPRPGAGD